MTTSLTRFIDTIAHEYPWLYVWQCGDCRVLKAGWSGDPRRRGREHRKNHACLRKEAERAAGWRFLLLISITRLEQNIGHGLGCEQAECALLHLLDCGKPWQGRLGGEWYAPTIARYRLLLSLRSDTRLSSAQPPLREWHSQWQRRAA